MPRRTPAVSRRRPLVALAVVLVGAGDPTPLRAQADARATGAWFDLGLSAGAYGTHGGSMAFTRRTPGRLWRVRMHAKGNDGWNADPARTVRSLGELAVQVGRAIGPCASN